MRELFEIPESLSPRAAWIKKHKIEFLHCPEHDGRNEDEFGHELYPWNCWSPSFDEPPYPRFVGQGMTQDDAIAEWAKFHRVRLWNEEGL